MEGNRPKILLVDACARKQSRTRELAEHLLKYLDGEVTRLRLYDEAVFPMDEDALHQREACLSCGNCDGQTVKFARQFASADEIIIAAPYWDFSFPAILKDYVENISVVGVTFAYDEKGQTIGLCRARHLYYVTTAGGPAGEDVFGYGYIRFLAERFGIQKILRFAAENLDIEGADVPLILEKAKNGISNEMNRK